MRENTIKTLWHNGEAAINGWLHIPSAWSAEVMAHHDWDSLTIDMQHGLTEYQMALHMLQAISTTNVIPFVRVTWNEPGLIMRMLDAGAFGIICPMVNTREQCETFVGACRYHPAGYRSLGPTRARIYGGADYEHHANDTIITMAMIETREALDNIDAIASTPGLDAFYIGPNDLRLSLMGSGGTDNDDPEMLDAIDRIIVAGKQNDVVTGIHTNSVDYARRMIERGAQFVTLMSDTGLLRSAVTQTLTAMRNPTLPQTHPSDPY